MKEAVLTFDQLPTAVSQLFQKMEAIELMLSKLSSAPTGNKNETDLLTIKEASQLLGLSIPTIYSKVSKRELPFSKPAGAKRLYFSRMELMTLISKGRVKTIDEVYSEAGNGLNLKGSCHE
jgi:excisionase family DNA binding protein